MREVFTGLSVITSQYFLAQINQNLIDVQEKLDQVLNFLYTDKDCEIYAQMQEITSIYKNYLTIMKCPEQRTASIGFVQQAKAIAEKNIQFYYRDMNYRILDELKKDNVSLPKLLKLPKDSLTSLAHNLSNELNSYNQVINLYCIASIMEITFSQNFDKDYLNYVEQDLTEHFRQHNQMMNRLTGELEALRVKVPGRELNQVFTNIQQLLNEDSPEQHYQKVIEQIQVIYNQPAEYHILKDGSVYQKLQA